MTTGEILPLPESTYRLLLDAAGAWPDAVATQWIPDPGDYTRCLAWTYAELAGTVTRIANALTALGVRRPDAVTLASVNTSMLYAATLAAEAAGIAAPVSPALSGERIAELIRRTGSRVLVAAGPELDPQLWQQLVGVARQAGMTAVLALRPDGARGVPPALDGDAAADGTPDGRPLTVAYLDEVIAGQPDSHLAGADPPEAGDLAAFVHTGGTTGAPKVAAHTHASQLACGRGIAECSGLAAGEGMLGGLPLFHVNALIVTGIAPMFSGARVVWPGPAGYRDKGLYARFWQIVEHYQIAAMSAVPTVVRNDRISEVMGSTATPRLKAGALQRPPRRLILSGIPSALRIGGLIPNPLASVGDGPPVRLDAILAGRTAVLTARRPDAGLVDFCRQHGLVLVQISSSHAAGTTGRPAADPDAGWIDVRLAGERRPAGPRALAVLGSNPALTVVVRPDRVVAAVEPRCRLPRLPWPIPATAGRGSPVTAHPPVSPITPARSRQHARRGSHVCHDLAAHDRGLSPSGSR
jgi:hypothetical protein